MHPFIADARRRRARAHDRAKRRLVAAAGAPDGVAHVALPPRARGGAHRRARDLESHRQDAASPSTRSARGVAFTGSTAPRGMPGATPSGASISSACRSRSRTRRRPRACCSSCGAIAATCACAATRCGRACARGAEREALSARARSSSVRPRACIPSKASRSCCMRSRRCAASLDVELQRRGRGPGAPAPALVGRELRASRSTCTFHGAVADMTRVLRPHRLPAARADHRSVRARRDRSGRARLPRRGGARRRLARGRRGRRQRPDCVEPTLPLDALRRARRSARRACRSASTTPPPTRSHEPRAVDPELLAAEVAARVRRRAQFRDAERARRARTCSRSRISPRMFAT